MLFFVLLIDGREVKNVALGSEHTICLATDNTVWAWGWNEHGNTGTNKGDNVFIPTPVPIEMSSTTIITQVYAGGAQNFIVTECNDAEKSDKIEDNL